MSKRDLSQSPWHAHLLSALEASAQGCIIARKGRERDVKAVTKSVGDYVSEIDVAIDRAVTDHLAHAFPDIPVISEELCPNFDHLPETCWIVDPLDGTNSYLAGARLELVSCMVALRAGAETVLSVVRFPFADEVYSAVRGCGAFRNENPVRVPEPSPLLSESWVAMNHYGDRSLETKTFAAMRDGLRQEGGAYMVTIDPPGSGLALRMTDCADTLAAVVHDNNPAKRKQELWDVVPIQLIVEEAGGVYLNEAGERYDASTTRPIIIAASREMADEILRHARS